MIGVTILAAALAAAPLDEAVHALAAGRTEQARTMVTVAMAEGARGERVDRLLADIAFASADWATARKSYERLIVARPTDALLTERAGIAALRSGDVQGARALLSRATTIAGASWRAWNARGVTADREGDWVTAEEAYGRALSLSPDNASVLNNLGWSLLLRGDFQSALEPLERAAQRAPAEGRIRANLDLARSALSESLPARRPEESASDWAARLNDAGVAALRQGKYAQAQAAFAQAIEVSDRWFPRAANNLRTVGGAQ